MRCLKSSHFVCLLLKLGCFPWFSTCAFSAIKTREWLEDRLKHDFATVKSQGILVVAQKSTRSGNLFLSWPVCGVSHR
jgi:hypothetical protein